MEGNNNLPGCRSRLDGVDLPRGLADGTVGMVDGHAGRTTRQGARPGDLRS